MGEATYAGALCTPRARSPACVFGFIFVLIYFEFEFQKKRGRHDLAENLGEILTEKIA